MSKERMILFHGYWPLFICLVANRIFLALKSGPKPRVGLWLFGGRVPGAASIICLYQVVRHVVTVGLHLAIHISKCVQPLSLIWGKQVHIPCCYIVLLAVVVCCRVRASLAAANRCRWFVSLSFRPLDSVPGRIHQTWKIVRKNIISRADRFERQTQIKGSLLPALGFLERLCEINHNRYSWNRKKLKISS